jgi:hypothetical protein
VTAAQATTAIATANADIERLVWTGMPKRCVTKPTNAPSSMPGSTIAQKWSGCPKAANALSAKPAATPAITPSRIDCRLRAISPATRPVRSPLTVDPITIGIMLDRASG